MTSSNKRPFKEFYLVINSKLKIIEGSKSLVEQFSIDSSIDRSKQFFLLFPQSQSNKIQSLIKEVIKEKKYHYAESKIKYSNKYFICSIDIMPKGNTAFLLLKDITKRKNLVTKLKRSQKQLRELAKNLQTVREEERKYFAMEVHDDLGQKLTALQIEIGLLMKKIKLSGDGVSINKIYENLKSINKLIKESLYSKQALLNKFRLDFLEEMGLIEAVRHYLEEFQSRNSIEYYFYSDWKHIDLEYNKSVALYRILQESLTNVTKHSNASEVHISFEERDKKVYLTIEDNGKGFTTREFEQTEGLGIIGMEERILLEKGAFSIKGRPGKGTRVQVTLNLK